MTEKLIFNQYEYNLAKTLPAFSGTGSTIETSITGLKDTSRYEFILLAYNRYGATVSGPITIFTQPPQTQNFLKPANINLEWDVVPIASNGLRIFWTDPFPDELNYNIYLSPNNQNFELETIVSEYAGSHDIENLILGNNYYVLINAFIGTGPNEGQLYLSTSTGPIQIVEIPKTPIQFKSTYFDNDEVTLEWIYPDTLHKQTEIFYSNNGSNYSTLLSYDSIKDPRSTVTIGGLTADLTWWFKIKTNNDYGSSDFAGPVVVTTLPNTPETPYGLTGFAGISSYIQLNWNSGATNEDGYNVFRSNDNVNYTKIETLNRDNISYIDLGLNENTLYYYKVNAFNEGGTSSFSNIVGITSSILPLNTPLGPTGVTASVFYNTINISWLDQSTNEFGYRIYLKQG